jgi:N-acetylglucosaminyldiphosphoundecaprenol N-acetyl-beta-D-mannosaminyltransferase
LWRIKEEPYLWRRYWTDGKSLLRLFFTGALPMILNSTWNRLRSARAGRGFHIKWHEGDHSVVVQVSGSAIAFNIGKAIDRFREALAKQKPICVDLSQTCMVDPRFFGLLLMVRKQLQERGQDLRLTEVPSAIIRAFRWNRFEFLLSDFDGMEGLALSNVAPSDQGVCVV